MTALTGTITVVVLAVNGYLLYDLLRQQVSDSRALAGGYCAAVWRFGSD